MGFRDKVRGEASKTFKGLVIDDMPSGNVVLRPMLLLVEMTLVLADKPEGLEEYLSEFDTAEMVALYRLWAKETQASESKSRKRPVGEARREVGERCTSLFTNTSH